MKLIIPGADGPLEDETALHDTIFTTIVLCLLLGLAAYLFVFSPRAAPVERAQPEQPQTAEQRAIVRAQSLAQAPAEARRPEKLTGEDALAILTYGPAPVAAEACEAFLKAPAPRPQAMQEALLRAVIENLPMTPWSCLGRAYWDGELEDSPALLASMQLWWAANARFDERQAPLVAAVVEDFRASRRRPADEGFWSWARLCALRARYPAQNACLGLLRQMAPQKGQDMLMMVDQQLDLWTTLSPEARRIVVRGLGELATSGQPAAWHIKETEALADYDVDLRQGATFLLCRLVGHPDREVASASAEQLSHAAQMTPRVPDELLIKRWQQTCAAAFTGTAKANAGTPENPSPEAPAPTPAQGVENVEGIQGAQALLTPDPAGPGLGALARKGRCEVPPGRPLWYCGARRFAGPEREVAPVLRRLFVETRAVDWGGER